MGCSCVKSHKRHLEPSLEVDWLAVERVKKKHNVLVSTLFSEIASWATHEASSTTTPVGEKNHPQRQRTSPGRKGKP